MVKRERQRRTPGGRLPGGGSSAQHHSTPISFLRPCSGQGGGQSPHGGQISNEFPLRFGIRFPDGGTHYRLMTEPNHIRIATLGSPVSFPPRQRPSQSDGGKGAHHFPRTPLTRLGADPLRGISVSHARGPDRTTAGASRLHPLLFSILLFFLLPGSYYIPNGWFPFKVLFCKCELCFT